MEKKKYTIDEIIEYVGKENIEEFCNNVYDKMLPKISEVVKPKLVISWLLSTPDINGHCCGSFKFPHEIIIYIPTCINAALCVIDDIKDSNLIIGKVILFVITHELCHATQDVNLLETYDSFYKDDKSYRTIVERDNDSRTYLALSLYSDFIKNEFNIDVNKEFCLNNNRHFYVLDDITKTRFISMVIETFLMQEFDTDEEMGTLMKYIISIEIALTNNEVLLIDLTVNHETIVLKSIADGICNYATPEEITIWLVKHDFTMTDDKERIIRSFNSNEIKAQNSEFSEIHIKVEMENVNV